MDGLHMRSDPLNKIPHFGPGVQEEGRENLGPAAAGSIFLPQINRAVFPSSSLQGVFHGPAVTGTLKGNKGKRKKEERSRENDADGHILSRRGRPDFAKCRLPRAVSCFYAGTNRSFQKNKNEIKAK